MKSYTFFKSLLILTIFVATSNCYDVLPVWGYECHNTKCIKAPFNGEHKGQSLTMCKLMCGDEIGTLWPKPTGVVKIGKKVAQIDRSKIRYDIPSNSETEYLWKLVKNRFRSHIYSKIPQSDFVSNGGVSLLIRITLNQTFEEAEELPRLTYDTDESYSLEIIESAGAKHVYADIFAETFFGARHGMETLIQLIVYDDIQGKLQVLVDTEISDAPVYKHRGILLDTARNYFSVKSIKRTIDAMSMSKMNQFHWHMIDSNSFPLVVKSHPDLHNLGAYSPRKVYTPEDINDIVEYARARGVRVIPEFDGPAHSGEGWQNTKMIVCFNAQPWKNFCNEPPCGQLDPTIDALYDVLEDIYREMFEAFKNPDVFHMGGDTVSFQCWNTSATIRRWMRSKDWGWDHADFTKLMGHFQTNALARLDKVAKNRSLPIILWESQLTVAPYLDDFLDKKRYIIQTSQNEADWRTRQILERGMRMITTNFDLFINGNTASWNGGGNINGWQKFYENRPDKVFGGENKLILGSEAAIWAEQVDEFSLDTLLWPKASALAERLWSNPVSSWARAESRLLVHRNLLTENRIRAESLEPEWCVQNQNECPREAYD